jgi:hypothetical protein
MLNFLIKNKGVSGYNGLGKKRFIAIKSTTKNWNGRRFF